MWPCPLTILKYDQVKTVAVCPLLMREIPGMLVMHFQFRTEFLFRSNRRVVEAVAFTSFSFIVVTHGTSLSHTQGISHLFLHCWQYKYLSKLQVHNVFYFLQTWYFYIYYHDKVLGNNLSLSVFSLSKYSVCKMFLVITGQTLTSASGFHHSLMHQDSYKNIYFCMVKCYFPYIC